MLTGIILAGGDSCNLNGKNKAFLPFPGELLLTRQITIMKKICDEIIVVSSDPKAFLPFLDPSIRMITNYISGSEPLSGMHAGLTLSNHYDVWVVSCDMPFLSAEAALLLLEERRNLGLDAAVPVISGVPQILHAIYHKNIVDVISAFLNAGDTHIKKLLNLTYWKEYEEDFFLKKNISLDFTYTIQTTEQYAEAISLLNEKNA